jgi:hypothetical protein
MQERIDQPADECSCNEFANQALRKKADRKSFQVLGVQNTTDRPITR